ncbi:MULTISPECIES: transcriptional regulator [Pseudomonas]|uniref:transcriptional regulator n=1 Tax=Pseudomonas TaxID=286 RepID=UPI00224ACD6B|nr:MULTISPECIES: transcriptional regulator [unclassified Pseudomonas]MCX2888287.1 transcriptional regulator [Pseudomonas sp. DCB_BI]MDH4550108.1 transcriptional regulator [Pseudomonas sp. BN607]
MSSSTSGIKLDHSTKARIKQAAATLDRTPHWFMKMAVLYWLQRVEQGSPATEMLIDGDIEADERLNSVLNRLKLLSSD